MNRKALLAEFIATFALVFVGVGSIAANHYSAGQAGLTGIALAHGLVIAVMATATGAISGGHINPAVSIGLFFAKKIDALNTIGYVMAQCLGALAGAFMIKLCFPEATLAAVGMGTPALSPGISAGMGLIMEIILTFFLVFAIYGSAVDKRAPKMGGLYIGLAVALGILAGGPITGAAMNPARHLGPALLGGGLENIWLYWLGPVLGGILAAVTYQKVFENS